MRSARVLPLLATAMLVACSHSPTAQQASSSVPVTTTLSPDQLRVQCETRYLDKFTLRQRLARLLTVGVKGYADASALAREGVGGLFIGSWTDKSMLTGHKLVQIDAIAPAPPMVTVDEEGGRVSRLGDIIGKMPSAREMAATMSPDQVYRLYLDRGRKMKDLGITVDFAPDADVTDGPADGVIGDRSFSGDPQTVAWYAGAAVRGLRDAGLGAVIKHFPGHGHGNGDSHTGEVTTPPLSVLQTTDLVAFRKLADSGAAVMVGHLDVPGLTTPGSPASVSPAAMALLRNGVDYDAPPFTGVIFTDDLGGMKAITGRMTIPEAVERALEAGADSALFVVGAADPVLDRLQQAVQAGRLTPDRINQSVLRIARYQGRLTC
jgi:beta-N-acetylhexosaminidase